MIENDRHSSEASSPTVRHGAIRKTFFQAFKQRSGGGSCQLQPPLHVFFPRADQFPSGFIAFTAASSGGAESVASPRITASSVIPNLRVPVWPTPLVVMGTAYAQYCAEAPETALTTNV